MRNKIVLITFLFYNIFSINAQSTKEFNQSEYIWDLSEIYASEEEWVKDYHSVNSMVLQNTFDSQTKFPNSKSLAQLLDSISALRTRVSKVAYYAILKWEEGQSKNGDEFLEKGEGIVAKFEASLADVEQNILNLGKEKLKKWLEKDKELYRHRHWLNLIIDQSAYRTNPETEEALRKVRNWISSSIDTYWELQSLKSIWPKFKDEDGNQITLNRSSYRKVRRSDNLNYKKEGTKLYYETLSDLSNIMAELYTNKIRAEQELGELRGFKDGIDANWFFYAGVPEGGYKVMLNAARANKQVLQKYCKARARVLGKDTLEYIDFYTKPNALNNFEYTFNKSMNWTLEASKKLGDNFHGNMKKTMKNKTWLHLADAPKTASYHVRSASGDVHPFMILKYQPSIVRSRTLTGGLFGVAASIPGIGADGTDVLENPAAGIYGNGLLYVGNILHDEVVTESIAEKDLKNVYLVESLEFLRTFFRHAIHTELDAKVQSTIKDDKQLDGEIISNKYLKILRDYYGHNKGSCIIPEYMKYDWITETYVMFLPKYEHQFWAPALASASAIIDKVKSHDLSSRNLIEEKYTNGKYDSYSVLKDGGIDLMSIASYTYIINRMNKIINQIE